MGGFTLESVSRNCGPGTAPVPSELTWPRSGGGVRPRPVTYQSWPSIGPLTCTVCTECGRTSSSAPPVPLLPPSLKVNATDRSVVLVELVEKPNDSMSWLTTLDVASDVRPVIETEVPLSPEIDAIVLLDA